jgi:hypothetical protein
VVVGQQQDPRAEQDPLRRGGHEAQAFERVGDRRGGREHRRAHRRARVQRDVLGHVEGLKADVFRVPGDRDHGVRVDPVEARVVHDAELHGALPDPHAVAPMIGAVMSPT